MNPIFHLVAPSLEVISAEKYPCLHARLTALSEAPESLLAVPDEATVSLELEAERKWEPLLATEEIKLAFAFTDLDDEDLEALRVRFSIALIDESGPLMIRKTKHLLAALNATIDKLFAKAMLNLLYTCEIDPDGTWKLEVDRYVETFSVAPAAAPVIPTRDCLLYETEFEAAKAKHLGAFKYCHQGLPLAKKSAYNAVSAAFLAGLNYVIGEGVGLHTKVRWGQNLAHWVVHEITQEKRDDYLAVYERLREARPTIEFELDEDRFSPMGYAAWLGKYHLFVPAAGA